MLLQLTRLARKSYFPGCVKLDIEKATGRGGRNSRQLPKSENLCVSKAIQELLFINNTTKLVSNRHSKVCESIYYEFTKANWNLIRYLKISL